MKTLTTLILAVMVFIPVAFGADVVIKDVPEGAEIKVKKMAMVAIERYLREKDVKVPEAVTEKFETDVDTIREANDIEKKFDRKKPGLGVIGDDRNT